MEGLQTQAWEAKCLWLEGSFMASIGAFFIFFGYQGKVIINNPDMSIQKNIHASLLVILI